MSQLYLSESQRNALELAHDNFGTDGTIDKHCLFQKSGILWEGSYEPLNDITMSDLAKAFYLGYKIKPEFKVGDWVYVQNVFDSDPPKIAKVTNVSENRILLDNGYDLGKGIIKEGNIRHATENEIQQEHEYRKWEEINRNVDEFHVNDIIKDKSGNYGYMYREILSMNPVYLTARCTGGVDIHYTDLKLICPGGERFDSM